MKLFQALIERQSYSRVDKADDGEKGNEEEFAGEGTTTWTIKSLVSWSYLLLTTVNIVGCVGWFLRKPCVVQHEQGLVSDRIFGNSRIERHSMKVLLIPF